jgi:hypothetical protein
MSGEDTEDVERPEVLVNMIQVNHGTLMEGVSPATLIVMKFQFLPGWAGRLSLVNVEMKFSKVSNSGTNPEVVDIAPKGTWSVLKSKTPEEVSHEVSPGIEGGGLKPAYKWILKQTKVEENSGKITGGIRALGWDRSKKNSARWTLEENDATKSGIPTLIQTAILLKREWTEETFKATLEFQGTTDVYASTGGKIEMDGDVFFNPKINRGAVKNENNLGGEDLEAFQKVVTMPEWKDH